MHPPKKNKVMKMRLYLQKTFFPTGLKYPVKVQNRAVGVEFKGDSL
jgi:hypothetical protein